MDPASIVSLISGCVGVSKAAGSLILGVQRLVVTYQRVEQDVVILISLLQTLQIAMNSLSRRIVVNSSTLTQDDAIKPALTSCLKACATLMADLQAQLNIAKPESGLINRWRRAKFVWQSAEITCLEQRLDHQVNALNLLLNVMQQDALAQHIPHQQWLQSSVLQQAGDDASTYTRDEDLETLISGTSDIELKANADIIEDSIPVFNQQQGEMSLEQSQNASTPKNLPGSRPLNQIGTPDPSLCPVPPLSSPTTTIPQEHGVSSGLGEPVKLEDQTNLVKAMKANDTALVKRLLVMGTDPNKLIEYDWPICVAVQGVMPISSETSLEATKLLLRFGANVKIDGCSFPPLCKVGYNKNNNAVEIARLLLAHGADIRYTNSLGDSPLRYAISSYNEPVYNFLLEAGADLQARNSINESLLHIACSFSWDHFSCYRTINMLLDAGFDPNEYDNLMRSPLYHPVYDVKLKLVKLLVERGAKVNVGSDVGVRGCGSSNLIHVIRHPKNNKYYATYSDADCEEMEKYLFAHGARECTCKECREL